MDYTQRQGNITGLAVADRVLNNTAEPTPKIKVRLNILTTLKFYGFTLKNKEINLVVLCRDV